MTSRRQLVKRLSGYWKVELANAVLVPCVLLTTAVMVGARPGVFTVLALPANVGLLTVGGLYWRAKLHQVTGRPETIQTLLPLLDRLQRPAQLLTTVAVVSAAVAWAAPALSRGLGDRILATVFACLAAAEYVNYYHRQLQHFDHLPDFRRLLSGRGFRRSQMATDLRRWRAAPR